MGLIGQLDDLPLLDMLQIIAFSKKSGYLRVKGPQGRGAVLLKEGRVVFSYSWSTVARMRELAAEPSQVTPEVIRGCIETSLRDLGSLREGSFQFDLTDSEFEGPGEVRIRPLLLDHGLDPQELLLDLAVELDDERRREASPIELACRVSSPAETSEKATEDPREPMEPPSKVPEITVVLVNDEKPVRDVLAHELGQRGYRIRTAEHPSRGAELCKKHLEQGERVALVVDLKMPASSGKNFHGGFELVRAVNHPEETVPVLLMVEGLSEKDRARAQALGIRHMAEKPTLSKIDPASYLDDLRRFASTVQEGLETLSADLAPAPDAPSPITTEEPTEDAAQAEYLATMTRKLFEPKGTRDVSGLVLEVSKRFLERGLLFVVKGSAAKGLAGYGIARDTQACSAIAQRIVIDIATCPPVAEVVKTGNTIRAGAQLESLAGGIFSVIDRGRANDAVLLPLLYNGATLLFLFGDNGSTGAPIRELSRLELFLAQAGMALENKFLQQKFRP